MQEPAPFADFGTGRGRRGGCGVCTALVLALAVGLCAPGALAQEATHESEADRQFDLAEQLFSIQVYQTAIPVYRKFLKDHPQHPRREEARYKLALSYFLLGGERHLKKALGELVTLQREFPTGKRIQDCLFRSAYIRHLLGDSKGVLTDLNALAKLNVREDLRIPMHHFLGRAHYDLGQNAEAIRHLSIVARTPKGHRLRRFALVVLADAYLKAGKIKECAATLDGLLRDEPKLENREEMWLKLGDARLALGEYPAALAAYVNVGANGPFKERATLGKARALLGLKKYPEAAKMATGLLAHFRETPELRQFRIPEQCHYIAGLAYYSLGKYAEAAASLARLLARVQSGPMAEDAAYKLCWSYYSQGPKLAKRLVGACLDFRRRFSASKWLPQVVFLTGEAHLWLGDYANAVTYFKQIDPKDPNYPDALYLTAYCYHKAKRPHDAAQAYDLYARKYGTQRRALAALVSAGGLYQAAGKYNEAIERYNAYLAKAPNGRDAAEVLYQRGVCFGKLSKLDEMARTFAQYAARFPTGKHIANALHWLGRYRRIQGDQLAAKKQSTQAVQAYLQAQKALAKSASCYGPFRDESLRALSECRYRLGTLLADEAADLAARSQRAKGALRARLEKEAAALRKQSADTLRRAAVGFLDLIRRKPGMIREESVYLWAGAYFREQKNPKAAIQTFEAFLTRFKASRQAHVALYQLALLHGETDPPDRTAVVRYCNELLRRYPRSQFELQTKFVKAEALYAMPKYAEAAALYEEVSRKGADRLRVASILKLGHIAFARKEYEVAAQHFAEIGLLYNDETFAPEALYYAGKCHVLLGDTPSARKFWGQLLGRFGRSTWAVAARRGLRKLGYRVGADGAIQKE